MGECDFCYGVNNDPQGIYHPETNKKYMKDTTRSDLDCTFNPGN